MRQAALTLGSAPDCGTFIYTLKVPHTHPPMPKSKGLTRPGFAMQSYIVIVSSTSTIGGRTSWFLFLHAGVIERLYQL